MSAIGEPKNFASLLIAVPAYDLARIQKTFDFRNDFGAGRAVAQSAMAPGSLVLAVDKIPGDLLYRTGLKGFRVEPPLSEKELVKWAHLGARYLIVPAVEKLMPTVIGRHVGNQAWVADGVAIYRLDVAPIRLSMP